MPKQRRDYIIEMGDVVGLCGGNERELFTRSFRVEEKYKKIKPPGGEKDGILWDI
jgi:hypothetical protein